MTRRFPLLYATLVLLFALGSTWPALRAEEEKPAPVAPPPAEVPAAPVPVLPPENPAEAPTTPAAPAVEQPKVDADEDEPKTTEEKTSEEKKISDSEDSDDDRRHRRRRSGNDRVAVGNDVYIDEGETVQGDAVAVLGDLRVKGEVGNEAVAVLGDVTIDGIVRKKVVAVMGDVKLGPKARVYGDVVSVGGDVRKDPAAIVEGKIVEESVGDLDLSGLRSWWDHALKMGRPLAVAAHLGWLWVVTGFSIAFYALLGLVFPRAVRSCGNNLVEQPGLTLLAAFLAVLALPVLFILLCITLVGIPVALFILPVLVIVGVLFGKASLYGLVGRMILRDRAHMVASVLLGALVFVLLYLVPFAGALLSLFVSLLGFGCVIISLFSAKKSSREAAVPQFVPAPQVASVAPPPAFEATSFSRPVEPPVSAVPTSYPAASALPPVISAATLPRVGFWLRLAASILDAVLIGIVCGLLSMVWYGFPSAYPLWYALYCVLMWMSRGTTIGGVICGLKVVRLDDRPLDFSVAMVRALGGFLSFAVAGLGFIWVVFDEDRQSWHDKIAGTTIVKVPRGTSLI